MVMQAIRDRAQSWISWVIVVLIIIVMAAFGLNAYFEPDSDVTVAQVNNTDIKFRRFQNAYESERSRVMQQLRGVDPALLESLGLKDSVLNRLIDEEVLFQHVLDSGFAVGDIQLASYINQIQMFQKEGRFDQETYEQLLSASRLSAAEWEQGQRKVLMLRQPESVVVGSAFAASKSLAQLAKFEDEQRTFGYAVFPSANYMKDVVIDDAQARAYFESNQDEYMHPERVLVEYVELSVADFAKAVEVKEEAILQRYEAQKAAFSVPERRRASHILIALDPEADSDAVAAAQKKADEVVAKLASGTAFEDIAKEYSDDPGSAAQGGDLGFFEQGIMDRAFEAAAFALTVGEQSSIVQSAFGLHVIKLTGVEAETTKPLNEVRATLEADYRESVAESQFADLAEQLDTLAFEHPDTLVIVADQLGLEVKTSEYFSRDTGQGIGQYPKIRSAAFQEDVLENGNNSPLIEISNNHVSVVRKKSFQAKEPKAFDEVRVQIVARLQRDQAAELSKLAAQGVLTQMKEGADVKNLLEPLAIEWHEPQATKRDAGDLDRSIISAVYAEKHPTDGVAVFGEVALAGGGDYAIYMLTEVAEGDVQALSVDNKQALKDRLMSDRGRAEYVSLVTTWRDSAEIKTYPERLE